MTAARILVTGAAGGLGRFVVDELVAAGCGVLALDRVPLPHVPPGVTAIVDDLSSRERLEAMLPGVTAIAHLAALPTPTAAREDIVYASNVLTTANLAYAAEAAGIGRLVFASSQSALGLPYAPDVIPPDYLPIDEAHPLRPLDGYGESKGAGERLCRMLSARGPLATICLRFPVIWSPQRFAEHVAARLGNPRQAAKSAWAYVDARDAARAVRLALEAQIRGHLVLNVTSRVAFADRPIGELVREWYGLDLPTPEIEAVFDWRKAEETIGFRSSYRWTATAIETIA